MNSYDDHAGDEHGSTQPGDTLAEGNNTPNIDTTRPSGRPAGDFDNQFETFQLFRSYLDTQMQTLRQDIRSDRDSLLSSVNAKIKKESTFNFKFDGNKKNFNFNCDILDDLDQLEAIVRRDCEKSFVRGLKAKVEARNKLIKIADSSPAGWATVTEYLCNDLASDSGDEKKIRSAENRALKKLKLSRSTKTNNHNAKRVSSSPLFHDVPDQRPFYENQSRFRGRRPMSDAFGGLRYTPYTKPYGNYGDKRTPGPNDICFRCGGRGHWGIHCEGKQESRGQSTGKLQ